MRSIMSFCKSKKALAIIAGVLVVVIIVVVVSSLVGSQWKRDFRITEGDWVSNGFRNGGSTEGLTLFDVVEKGNPYYEYTIQNMTNREMSNIVIVFDCVAGIPREKWKYEYSVGSLTPYETKTVKVYYWPMHDDKPTMGSSYTIAKIKYKKSFPR